MQSNWRRAVLLAICTLGASVGCASPPTTQEQAATTAPSAPTTAPLVTQSAPKTDSARPPFVRPPVITNSDIRQDRIVRARMVPAPSPQPQRLTASFMLQIAGETESALANASTLSTLLTTTPILEPALATADVSMEQWRRNSGQITAQPAGSQLVTVTVSLADDEKLPSRATEKILGSVCEQAIATVVAAWDRQDAALTAQLAPPTAEGGRGQGARRGGAENRRRSAREDGSAAAQRARSQPIGA